MPSKYPNSGTLGKNNRRRPDSKDPAYSGSCEVDGVEYWLSGWVKDGRDGSKFFSLAFKRKDAPKQAAPAVAPQDDHPPQDDDVPF